MEDNQGKIKRIIIVSYRLPFRAVKKKNEHTLVQNSGGLVSAILSLSQRLGSDNVNLSNIVWIGTGDKKITAEEIPGEFKLCNVVIPSRLNEKYYGGFCNNTIWPLFHYFPSRTVYNKADFEAYTTANYLFFKELKNVIKPGDFVWVHDYHLFLLPQMIRKHFPGTGTGFFLHIPFPSYELFRLLPRQWRRDILTGMTGSDVVGFHTNDYTQHFIKSVKRTLGFKVEQNYIALDTRLCKADTFPIGIDFQKFSKACFSEKVLSQKKRINRMLGENKLVFSVDRLDYSKGLLFRLKAYERFLEKYPEWHFKAIFNMVVVPSRDTIEDYRQMKREIEATVGMINGKFSTLNWRPIIYQYHSLSFNELVAIYDTSDSALITPLRDGMNLVAKEFVACQNDNPGVLILSEMTGAASELNEAILINPTDIEETADAIDKSLRMRTGEKLYRLEKMKNRISRYDVFKWASDFFQRYEDVKKEQELMKVNFIDGDTLASFKSKYLRSDERLFLLDYDGTLTPLAKLPEMAIMSVKTRKILQSISSDHRNTVVIISGRDRKFMEEQFLNMNVILVSEHGYFVKYSGEDWQSNHETDLSWKNKIVPLLDNYVDRCNGSMMEEKTASVVWHYRNAEEDIASLRINELRDDLSEILRNEQGVHILEGDKVLEVKSIYYDKGTAANELIHRKKYDFILALGDDHTDEDLFRAIPGYGFTVKVGNKPSIARYNTRNQQEIIKMLACFADQPVNV